VNATKLSIGLKGTKVEVGRNVERRRDLVVRRVKSLPVDLGELEAGRGNVNAEDAIGARGRDEEIANSRVVNIDIVAHREDRLRFAGICKHEENGSNAKTNMTKE